MPSHILLDYSYLGPGGVLGATSVMLALAVVAVALRFFTRYQQECRMLADDFLVLAGLVLQGMPLEPDVKLTKYLDTFCWDVYSNDSW